MEFDVSEYSFRDFVPYRPRQGYEHGFRKGLLHESFHEGEMCACKRHDVLRLRTEAQGYGEFQEESYVEVAEVALYGIKKQYILLAPFV